MPADLSERLSDRVQISGCARTADIPAGYAGASEFLAGKFRTFGSGLVALRRQSLLRRIPISVSVCPRPVRYGTETAFGKDAHEIDAAAGDDEGLEAVGAYVEFRLQGTAAPFEALTSNIAAEGDFNGPDRP